MIAGMLAAWWLAIAAVTVGALRRPGRRGVTTSHGADARACAGARVLLVRPCTGDAASTRAAMATRPHVGADVQLRWVGVVAETADPAWPLVQHTAAALRDAGTDAHALVSHARGPNRKAEQIDAAVRRFGGDVDAIVVVDADVDLDAFALESVLASLLADPGVGVSWSAPVEVHAHTRGDRRSRAILGGSLHAFVLLRALDPGLLVGKLFAIRPATLAAIGGAASLRLHLGEDFELSRRVREQGLRVVCCDAVATSVVSDRAYATVLDRYTRWLAVVRAQRPARMVSYPLLLAAVPLLLALAVACAPAQPWIAATAILATLLLRRAITWLAAARAGLPRAIALHEALAGDVLLLHAWLRALRGAPIAWAGQRLRLGRDGRLQP